jgi:hypothetical protein
MDCIRCIQWQKEMGAVMCPMCAAEKQDSVVVTGGVDGTSLGLNTIETLETGVVSYDADDTDKLLGTLTREHNKYFKALERISGMCGAPDAAQACRNIVAFIKETLK